MYNQHPSSSYRRRSSTGLNGFYGSSSNKDVFYTPGQSSSDTVQHGLVSAASPMTNGFPTYHTNNMSMMGDSLHFSTPNHSSRQLYTASPQPQPPSMMQQHQPQQYQEDDGYNPFTMEYYMTDTSKTSNETEDNNRHYPYEYGHQGQQHGFADPGKDSEANYLPSLMLDALAGGSHRMKNTRSPGTVGRSSTSRSPAPPSQQFMSSNSLVSSSPGHSLAASSGIVPKTPLAGGPQRRPSGTPHSFSSSFKSNTTSLREESEPRSTSTMAADDPDAPPTRGLSSFVPGSKRPVSFARTTMKLSVSPPKRGDSPQFSDRFASASPSPVLSGKRIGGRSSSDEFLPPVDRTGSPQMTTVGRGSGSWGSPISSSAAGKRGSASHSPLLVPNTPTPFGASIRTSTSAISATNIDPHSIVTVSGFPIKSSSLVRQKLDICGPIASICLNPDASDLPWFAVKYTSKVGAAQALHLDGRLSDDGSWKYVVKRGDVYRAFSSSSSSSVQKSSNSPSQPMFGILKGGSTYSGKDTLADRRAAGGLATATITSSELLLDGMESDAPPPLLTHDEAFKAAANKVYPDLPSPSKSKLYSSLTTASGRDTTKSTSGMDDHKHGSLPIASPLTPGPSTPPNSATPNVSFGQSSRMGIPGEIRAVPLVSPKAQYASSKAASETSSSWQNMNVTDLPGSETALVQPAGVLSRISDFLFGW